MPVDPAVRELLDAWGEPGEFDLRELRRGLEEMARAGGQPLPVAEVRDEMVAGVPVRTYRPDGPPRTPRLVWCHGGGYVAGDVDAVDPLCRLLANRTGAAVTSVDYRLAPEHPFPAAVEDCVAVLRELGNTGPLSVGGDSAGGGVAAAACLVLRGGETAVAAQVLLNPFLDATLSSASVDECATGYGLTRRYLERFAELYVAEGDPADPLCSPVLAPSLHGLPPAVIVTAEFDPLRDEAEIFGTRLHDAGGRAEVRRWNGMVHGFYGMWGVTPAAEEALDWTIETLVEVAPF